jgi:rhamnosyltransferase
MNGVADSKIFAVVVTFIPKVEELLNLIETLQSQVAGIVVVDNTPHDDCRVESSRFMLEQSGGALIRLGDNFGIAKALNVGIEFAIKNGAKYVLLSDQDSMPSTSLVSGLLHAYVDLTASGVRVGAIGPSYTDLHTNINYPFQVHVPGRLLYGHASANAKNPCVETFTLITSGTLIPVDALSSVGLMREDFFIDHVDIEWCHRARASGYRLYGTSLATMCHRMGDAYLRVWFFGWRRESAYLPGRIYYRIRNFVVLCKAPYIPLGWKLRSGWFWLGFCYSHVFFGQNRLASFRMVIRGFYDGLRGQMGRIRS